MIVIFAKQLFMQEGENIVRSFVRRMMMMMMKKVRFVTALSIDLAKMSVCLSPTQVFPSLSPPSAFYLFLKSRRSKHLWRTCIEESKDAKKEICTLVSLSLSLSLFFLFCTLGPGLCEFTTTYVRTLLAIATNRRPLAKATEDHFNAFLFWKFCSKSPYQFRKWDDLFIFGFPNRRLLYFLSRPWKASFSEATTTLQNDDEQLLTI